MELSIGDIIKLARKRQGLTQAELGELLGVGKSTIQKYEGGAVTNLKLETIREMCHHLDLLPYMLIFPEYVVNGDLALSIFNHNNYLKAFLELNDIGQVKAYEYIMDLLLIEKYSQK